MGMPEINPSDTTRCQAITDIIESVALEQAALSHILNAEGEKLQKIICSPRSTTEILLKANKSAKATVDSIARLEMVFQSKLDLFDCCLCEECETTTTSTTTTTESTT